jgi:hypothetical protein
LTRASTKKIQKKEEACEQGAVVAPRSILSDFSRVKNGDVAMTLEKNENLA